MLNRFESVMPPQEHAEAEIEGLSPEKWIEISPSGLEVDYFGGKREKLKIAVDEKDKMTYDSNNGVIAFVDGEGRMHVAPATSDRLRALEKAGYKQGNLRVPFSNGELPAILALREQWEKMRESAYEQNRRETIKAHLGYYRAEAEKKQIKEVAGEWLPVDGVEIEWMGTEKSIIERNTDGYNMAGGRLEKVGTYDSSNGVIAFVDGEGRMWVAPATSDRFQALEKAGYKHRSMRVPFSSGELPTNPALREQWKKMIESARKER